MNICIISYFAIEKENGMIIGVDILILLGDLSWMWSIVQIESCNKVQSSHKDKQNASLDAIWRLKST